MSITIKKRIRKCGHYIYVHTMWTENQVNVHIFGMVWCLVIQHHCIFYVAHRQGITQDAEMEMHEVQNYMCISRSISSGT